MTVSLKDSLVTIWRVENGEGQGPFRDPLVKRAFTFGALISVDDRPETPPALSDPLLCGIFGEVLNSDNKQDWCFAFTEAVQYQLWFGDEEVQEVLACRNYQLKKYAILPEFIHEGTNQCMFWRPAALQYDDP